MNHHYTHEERKKAVAEYRRTKSVTKTIRNLGYPGSWTLYKWLREPLKPGRPPREQAKTLRHYPWTIKIEAVQMFQDGLRPPEIAAQLDLHTPMSVYRWAQTFRESGEWGLMSKKERRTQRNFPTQASLEASLPDDPTELRKLAARLMVEKAVMNEELTLIKKDASVTPGKLTNHQKTLVVDALRQDFPLPMLLKTTRLGVSSFYYQLAASSQPDRYAEIRTQIHELAKQAGYTYGYRRIWWALRHEGVIISEKVVQRLMREEHIAWCTPRDISTGIPVTTVR